jgi:histidinol-phosphate aminotransferase
MKLSPELRRDFLARGYSRRSFGRLATLLAGGAALPFSTEAALAQLSYAREAPPDAVMINSNENPLGPCAAAIEAMNGILRRGGRYLFEETGELARAMAEQEGVPPECVQCFAGSSDPLHRTVLAFTSPTRAYVTADPTFESGELAARFVGAEVKSIPLTAGYAHDVKAMLEAGKSAGVFYVCNPNNPTGTLTPRADIEWLLANKPAGSVVLLDEAYIHFCGAPTCTDLVAKGKDLIVLRTFSKIYGMAGLRAGVAIARPDLLEKIRPYGTGYLPTTGMVGARVSLGVKSLVAERKRIVKDIREDVLGWLDGRRFKVVPSESNKFMVDVGRPGGGVARAMAAEKVIIGRVWPIWPNHVRVTVGTREEMEKFKRAFARVMA